MTNSLSPEGNRESSTREGPLLGLQKYNTIFEFLRVSKAFIARMEGWVGGYQKCLLIFLNFQSINKHDVLIPNMILKVV